MAGGHRTRTPWARLGAAIVALLAVATLTVTGAAWATTSARTSEPGTTTARTVAVPGLNQGESATFRIVDTGSAIVIHGDARGMLRGTDYVSLIYPDGGCAKPEQSQGFTLAGSWRNHGDGRETLDMAYDGAAYRAVRGKIGSESIRAITAASNAGNGQFSLTAEARACATLTPGR